MVRLVGLFLLIPALLGAQTPKARTVENVSVVKTWVITGYAVDIPDAANPASSSMLIKFQVTTTLDGEPITTEARSVSVSGQAAMLAFMTDVSTRVAAAIAARDPNAYYTGTRAALYAWLQANGQIDRDAK
jgi:hypothetical protein